MSFLPSRNRRREVFLDIAVPVICVIMLLCIDADQKEYEEKKRKTVLYDREYETDKWYRS